MYECSTNSRIVVASDAALYSTSDPWYWSVNTLPPLSCCSLVTSSLCNVWMVLFLTKWPLSLCVTVAGGVWRHQRFTQGESRTQQVPHRYKDTHDQHTNTLQAPAWVMFLAVWLKIWPPRPPPPLFLYPTLLCVQLFHPRTRNLHLVLPTLGSVLHQPQARPPGPPTSTAGGGSSLGTACCQRRPGLGTAPSSRRGWATETAQLRFGQWNAAMNMDRHVNSVMLLERGKKKKLSASDMEQLILLDCWQLW